MWSSTKQKSEESKLLPIGNDKISFSKDFPLHYLAKVGDPADLQLYLILNDKQAAKEIHRYDFYGRTPLHYVALSDNLTGGEQCATKIINLYQRLEKIGSINKDSGCEHLQRGATKRERRVLQKKVDISEETAKFVNCKDGGGETALSLAAINENSNVVQNLLAKSADVLTRSGSGERALELIYANTPSAIIGLLNQSVLFDYGNQSYDLTKAERSYLLDLSPIVGEPETLNCKRSLKEVDLLHFVNKETVRERGTILKHPLIQVFLMIKSKKFKYFNWFAILFHIIWVGFYNWIVLDVYYENCNCNHMQNYSRECNYSSTASENITFAASDINTTNVHVDKVLHLENDDVERGTNNTIGRAVTVIILSVLITIKEIYKMFFLKLNYFKAQNMILWALIVISVVTAKPNIPVPFCTQFQISTFGVVISGLFIILRIHKHIYWAIYIKVLMQVFNRFVAILPIFMFIMVIFAVSLRMHFPSAHPSIHFVGPNQWNDFRNAIMHIFGTITGGKVEWVETYKDLVDQNFRASGFIIYIAFYVIISLLLFKILTGFVVADTKKLQEQEEINSISADLEAIFIYESFLLSKTYDLLSNQKCFSFLDAFRERFLLCKWKESNRILKITVMESEIESYDLRKEIRMLASKNTAKLKKPEYSINTRFEASATRKSQRVHRYMSFWKRRSRVNVVPNRIFTESTPNIPAALKTV